MVLSIGQPHELIGVGGQVQRRCADRTGDQRQVKQRVVFENTHVDAKPADGAQRRLVPGERARAVERGLAGGHVHDGDPSAGQAVQRPAVPDERREVRHLVQGIAA